MYVAEFIFVDKIKKLNLVGIYFGRRPNNEFHWGYAN